MLNLYLNIWSGVVRGSGSSVVALQCPPVAGTLLCGCSTGAQATGPLSSEGTVILEWTSDRENRRQSSLGTKAEAACTVSPQLAGGQKPARRAAECVQSLHPVSASHVRQLRSLGDRDS